MLFLIVVFYKNVQGEAKIIFIGDKSSTGINWSELMGKF